MAELIAYGSTSNRTIDNNNGPENWDALHDAADGDEILDNYDDPYWVIFAGVSRTASMFIYRGYLFFDLSDIPATASISSVILSIYGHTVYYQLSGSLYITEGVQADPIVLSNYGDQLAYTTVLGEELYEDLSTEQYNNITLNAAGKTVVGAALGGTLKLCLRSYLDVNDSLPGVGSDVIYFYSAQKGGDYRPKLTVDYSAAVYPTDATTRVTSITHRYNRGVYNMELGLGEVVSDFGIPHVDTRTEESYDREIVPPYFKPGWRPPEETRLPQKPATGQYIEPVSPPTPKLQAQATPYERPVGMVERAARAGRAVVGFAEKQKAGMERTFEWMFGRFF